jgi:hypothetical protein
MLCNPRHSEAHFGGVMKRLNLLALAFCGLSLFDASGCGSTSQPPPPVISVALSPNIAPPLDANQSVSLTAKVTNDSSGQGVNWTVTCPAGGNACGTMAQAKSASGATNQYVAPANLNQAETVTVTATSVSDSTKSASAQVTVNPALNLVNPPPAQPQPGLVGGAFSYNLANFVQGGTAPFTWAIRSGTLPDGLTLDSRSAVISGTPTSATSSPVVIVLTCTDSASPPTTTSANPQISITINKPADLKITSAAPPDGAVNMQYSPTSLATLRCVWQHRLFTFELVCTSCPSPSACAFLPPCSSNVTVSPCRKNGAVFGFVLTATGGVPSYIWTLAAGSALPAGLNLSTSGMITGKPTQFGSFSVSITVSDSALPPHQTTVTYTIKIAPPPPPVVDVIPTLPIGTLNSPYVGFTFSATQGALPLSWSATGLPPGFSLSSTGTLSGTPTAIGSFPVSIQLQDAAGQNAAPQQTKIEVLAKGFSPTGSLGVARVWHTATLLGNGKVLVSGGVNTDASITTAELYEPATAKFSQTIGSPTQARFNATATLLKSGKVLLTGGSGPLAAAELYDPATDMFVATTGSMLTARFLHTATLLDDGTVLITGGLDPAGSVSGTSVASAEIYDPSTNSFTLLSNSMSTGRSFHTATLLGTGKVLIAGGSGTASAELYDPATKTFTPADNMTLARAGHAATLLKDGKVLLSGGADSFEGTSSNSAEIYDPGTGKFTTTNSMIGARSLHSATLLNNGQVLIAGGSGFFYLGGQSDSLSGAELFDPTTGNFTATADMTAIRESHTATLLPNGQVLIVGGSDGTLGYSPTTTVLASAELH